MNKKKRKILNRAEDVITKYRDDVSVYYLELIKSYREYHELDNVDKTTEDLYLEHIDSLCDFVLEKKHSNKIIIGMFILLTIMLIMTTFSTIQYYEISTNLKNNIVKANDTTSLIVNYDNLDNFNAMTFSNEEDYINLKPLKINLTSSSKDNKKYKIHYNVYIVEQNDNIATNNLISREAFLYNVTSNNKNSGIKSLKSGTITNGRILIYSGTFAGGEEENIELRLWLDSKSSSNNLNKTYKFKLYVDGYAL